MRAVQNHEHELLLTGGRFLLKAWEEIIAYYWLLCDYFWHKFGRSALQMDSFASKLLFNKSIKRKNSIESQSSYRFRSEPLCSSRLFVYMLSFLLCKTRREKRVSCIIKLENNTTKKERKILCKKK